MTLCMPRARQQSFYSTGFSCFRFQYNGLQLPYAYFQLIGYFAISEGKRFLQDVAGTSGRAVVNDITLPNSKTVAISCCASSKEQSSLKEHHSLREQALRVC